MSIDMVTQRQLLDVSDRRGIRPSRLWALWLVAGLAAVWPYVLAAQSPAPTDDMVRAGDRWSYDTKDEITGFPTDTYTHTVTEVSPADFVVNLTFRGKNGSSLVIFDHGWNRLENPTFKYKPNDGQGIREPLAIGKEWRFEFEGRNKQTGSGSKTSGVSKIVAQEMVTTSAGTFATFKIETRKKEISAGDQSKSWDYENVGWYAPQINHWVRRTFLTKIQNRTSAKSSEELIDFSRRQ
jgi:hypothetical protein